MSDLLQVDDFGDKVIAMASWVQWVKESWGRFKKLNAVAQLIAE